LTERFSGLEADHIRTKLNHGEALLMLETLRKENATLHQLLTSEKGDSFSYSAPSSHFCGSDSVNALDSYGE
jgi:hypothetical protein